MIAQFDRDLRNWSITFEFEEIYRLWLVDFLRLKAYYIYCRPRLKTEAQTLV